MARSVAAHAPESGATKPGRHGTSTGTGEQDFRGNQAGKTGAEQDQEHPREQDFTGKTGWYLAQMVKLKHGERELKLKHGTDGEAEAWHRW